LPRPCKGSDSARRGWARGGGSRQSELLGAGPSWHFSRHRRGGRVGILDGVLPASAAASMAIGALEGMAGLAMIYHGWEGWKFFDADGKALGHPQNVADASSPSAWPEANAYPVCEGCGPLISGLTSDRGKKCPSFRRGRGSGWPHAIAPYERPHRQLATSCRILGGCSTPPHLKTCCTPGRDW